MLKGRWAILYQLDLWRGWRLCPHDQSPVKTLDAKFRVSLPRWLHACCHVFAAEVSTVYTSTGRRQPEAVHVEGSSTLHPASLPLADFNQYPLATINHNHE